MRLIARSTLAAFSDRNPGATASLLHWQRIVREAEWKNVTDVQAAFSKAKALNGDRVRFEVAGGDFRLIVAFDFGRQIAFVKFVGSHAEYDKVDALSVTLY